VEIIDRDAGPGEDVVKVAYASTQAERAMIGGLLKGAGIRSISRRGSGGIFVLPDHAAAARKLLAETLVAEPSQDPLAEEIAEAVEADYLPDTAAAPRADNVVTGYARAFFAALALVALVLVAFLLLH
jgi:hypothetical protein